MKSSKRKRAFSLLEVIVAAALLAALMALLAEALRQSQRVFRSTTGATDASSELRKVVATLRRELIQARYEDTAVANSGGVPPAGSALWFLSNINPSTGAPCYMSDGTPYWQRNILYYITPPTDHGSIYGRPNCPLGAGPNGADDRCPHKMLIRKEIDFGPPTDDSLANEGNVEALIPAGSINAYITPAATYNLTAMVGGEVKLARVIGHSLLGFHVVRANAALDCDLRAVSLLEAQRNLQIGAASLYSTPYTISFNFSVFPEAK